jgi:hypothetical protein
VSDRASGDPSLAVKPVDSMEGISIMTEETRNRIAQNVVAIKEEAELETLVSVLGSPVAQRAAKTHTLPELVASEQDHGTDYLNGAFNRRAA